MHGAGNFPYVGKLTFKKYHCDINTYNLNYIAFNLGH